MNWWIAIKKIFSELPYDNLGDIGTFILSLVSVFTAFVTVVMLSKQNKLQQESLSQQQLVQQPLFNIYYELIDSDNDGKYEDEILNISNDGQLFKQIKNISVTTIFDVATNSQHSLLKIVGYFYYSTSYQNLKGIIYKSRGKSNNKSFYDIYIDVIEKSKIGERFYEIYKYNLIKIEYIDIHNIVKVCYYKDRINIDECTYNEIITQITNKQDILDIDKITFEDIFINEIK